MVLPEHGLSAVMCNEEPATQPLKSQKGNFLQPEQKFSLSCSMYDRLLMALSPNDANVYKSANLSTINISWHNLINNWDQAELSHTG